MHREDELKALTAAGYTVRVTWDECTSVAVAPPGYDFGHHSVSFVEPFEAAAVDEALAWAAGQREAA